ncbi:sulfur carrier protein ThiS [Larsenimonas rhizosphaerae]|uniref:Sulfur carrier protein ThiS n=1 Tax=Larsenimonas rhizosphaerae TaxID=2944682 RepID=A0AA41ZIC5_9GAMM|nr:sulfur carrier protein ThiS [Larsenimonas rhizosphaerae]MCM2129744.1 sulfur carrier protein ThiS [Larsenimonas rhizosphaerae]MCX2524403.1 sulfur carrier protein ThiS [Larsenimonas rhizosphaerae]
MQLLINGEWQHLEDTRTVSELLDTLGLAGKRVAVELNESIVPRSTHADVTLADGDQVEIVHAIGGG